MSDDLKPCPFCKGEASKTPDPSHSTGWEVGCFSGKCDVEPHVWAVHLETAVMQWNTRSDADRIEQLERERDEEGINHLAWKLEAEATQANLIKAVEALRPLIAIADAFDENELDDDARKFWGENYEHENRKPHDQIELYSGRGGKRLLTLGDAMNARTVLAELDGQ